MSEQSARTVFAQALLADVAPDEAELFESYEAAALGTSRDGHAGTGMGLPPEIAGAIGMVAVLVGHSVFNKLLEWAAGVGTDIIKKVVVDASVQTSSKAG